MFSVLAGLTRVRNVVVIIIAGTMKGIRIKVWTSFCFGNWKAVSMNVVGSVISTAVVADSIVRRIANLRTR